MLENLEDLKVAIVYDRANKLGGAERLLLSLSKIFPRAHLFYICLQSPNCKMGFFF